MGLLCTCPAGTAIPTIYTVDCTKNYGQIQKIIFQRLRQADGTANEISAPTTKASWTALLSASAGTKIAVSPYINAPTSEAGAARTEGGGNESINGIETVIGSEPTTFSATFKGIPQATIAAMKPLMCEAKAGNLGVFLVNAEGVIIGKGSATAFAPIPVRNLFISDMAFGGLEASDVNNISWVFEPNYSDNLVDVNPTSLSTGAWNPLTDLVVTES